MYLSLVIYLFYENQKTTGILGEKRIGVRLLKMGWVGWGENMLRISEKWVTVAQRMSS